MVDALLSIVRELLPSEQGLRPESIRETRPWHIVRELLPSEQGLRHKQLVVF